MLVGVYDYTAESLFMDMPLQKMILQFLAGTDREKIHYNTKIEESGPEAKHSLNGWLAGWLVGNREQLEILLHFLLFDC